MAEGRNVLGAAVPALGLTVYTTHLARWTGAAVCQLAALTSLDLAATPAVLAGDFNLEAETVVESPPCDGIPPRPLDLLAGAGFSGPASQLATYPSFDPVEAIDHVFTGPDVVRLRAGRGRNCYARLCSSDHRPYYADVRTS
jgi:endonuclease/exonuclease/phosphatase family metal-dependent hydrolase